MADTSQAVQGVEDDGTLEEVAGIRVQDPVEAPAEIVVYLLIHSADACHLVANARLVGPVAAWVNQSNCPEDFDLMLMLQQLSYTLAAYKNKEYAIISYKLTEKRNSPRHFCFCHLIFPKI